jgi:hypothetical protein
VGTDHRVKRAGAVAAVVAAAAVGGGVSGCRKHEPVAGSERARPSTPASASAAAPPVDRLAPGELAPGTESIYGLVLPRGMKVSAQFPRIAHATGSLPAEDVANYVRDRVDVRRVELGAVGTVFPAVHIHGGEPDKVYRIEVHGAGNGTEMVLRDVTPLPPTKVDESIPIAERWRRAGYNPDGTPLDPNRLK